MKLSILEDGVTHINVYSKGRTELGKKLSNFYCFPINMGLDGTFYSIEAYWYYLRIKQVLDETLKRDPTMIYLPSWEVHLEELSRLSGYKAKDLGRDLLKQLPPSVHTEPPEEFKAKIKEAIRVKLETLPGLKEELIATNDLPILHYYWFGYNPENVRIVAPKDVAWITEYIVKLRKEFQEGAL